MEQLFSKYLTLVTNNLKLVCKAPEHNKLFARSELELHFVELLSYERAVRKYIDEYGTMHFDKNSLTVLHSELFSEIYEWGGRIRTEEIVVGNRDAPTESPENIAHALDEFFSTFNRKYKNNTVNHIDNVINGVVDLNMYLNWIHPFKDGNGRSIRLFSQLFALQNGFRLDWKFLETRYGKKKYHHSIRKAVHYFNEPVSDSRLKQCKHLHELIRQAIAKLK